MASTLTTFANLMKTRYTPDKVMDLVSRDRPFLAKLAKSTEFSGDGMVIPVIDILPQGVSVTLANAQTQAATAGGNVGAKKFTLTTADYNGSVSMGSKVLMAARNNMGAFLENKRAETEGVMEIMADSIHTHLWGNGGGAIGQRASVSGSITTLVDTSDIYAFHEGMTLVASGDGDGSAGTEALRSGSARITAVNYEEGKFTTTGTITSYADNDYLFRLGDFLGGTGANLLKGVPAYITATSSPAALYGMTRTSNPTALAGCRVASADLTGKNIEQRLKLLGSHMSGRFAARVGKDCYMNPEDWVTLEGQLSSRGIRALEDQSTKFGFSVLKAALGGTNVNVYSDRAVPKGTAFLLNMDTWKLWSMGELIHSVNHDGLTMLRNSTTNDFEYRLESFLALANNAPKHNGRVPLT